MTHAEPNDPEPGPDASVADLHADIQATRRELGETVEALTAKLDVKQQAKNKVGDAKELVAQVPPIGVLALLVVIVGVVIWKRRR